jgi:hypothetical protein
MAYAAGAHSVGGSFAPHVLRLPWVLEIPPRTVEDRLAHGHEQTFHVVLQPQGHFMLQQVLIEILHAGRPQRTRRGRWVALGTQRKRQWQAHGALRVDSLRIGVMEYLTAPVPVQVFSLMKWPPGIVCRPDQQIGVRIASRYPDGVSLGVAVSGLRYVGPEVP